MDHDSTQAEGVNDSSSGVAGETSVQTKNKIHPFLIEINGKWYDLANTLKNLNKEKPLIKMDGEHLKVHCKNDEIFCKTQAYIGNHTIAYTTLSPNELKSRKVCIRLIQPYTEPELIINVLKEHDFIANRASILKSRRTSKPKTIYFINILPRAKFEEIYQIQKLCYVKVTIERFKGTNIVKQCYRCQGFGHTSEI